MEHNDIDIGISSSQVAPLQARLLIDVPTLAAELAVSQRFVRRLVAEDRVPFLKIGKFIRFDPCEIDRWLEACRSEREAATSRPPSAPFERRLTRSDRRP